jgi:hypothetical protein
MKQKLIISFIFSIIVIILVSVQLATLTKNAFSSQNPEEDYDLAISFLSDGRIDAAITMLEKITLENPGTKIAAACHFELAGIYGFRKGDVNRMLQEYQTVAQEYSGTPMGVEAELYLINCNYLKEGDPFDGWLQKVNELIVKQGGISVYDIMSAHDINKDKWWNKIFALSPESRNSTVPLLYSEVEGRLPHRKKEDAEKSIQVKLFIRTYFPRYKGNYDCITSIRDTLLLMHHITDCSYFPHEKFPPSIRLISPEEERCTGGEHCYKIIVELDDGDISQFQIDLSKLVFTMDEEDLIDKMRVSSTINQSCRVCTDGHGHHKHDRCDDNDDTTFEKIRLEYQTSAALTKGSHTIYVKAMDVVNNTTEKNWTFHVR